MRFSPIFALLLAIGAVVFALQNPGFTDLQFAPYHLKASTALILISAIAIGGIIGSLTMLPGRHRRRKEIKHLKQTIRDMTEAKEQMVAPLRKYDSSEVSG